MCYNYIVNNKEKKTKNYNIQISYIEVYNEILKDLLNRNDNPLSIRTDPSKGIIVMGAEFKTVTNANDAFRLLISGNKRRREEPTVHNHQDCTTEGDSSLSMSSEIRCVTE